MALCSFHGFVLRACSVLLPSFLREGVSQVGLRNLRLFSLRGCLLRFLGLLAEALESVALPFAMVAGCPRFIR